MKTTKFLLPTLIAAAAMTANAYADTTVTVGDYSDTFTTVTLGTTVPSDTSSAWWVSGDRAEISSDAFAGGTIILGSGSYVTDGTSTDVTANQLFLQGWEASAAFDVTSTLVLGASSGDSSAGIRFGADGSYAVNVSGDIILGADAIIIGGGTHGSISGNISGNHVLTINNMSSAFTFGMSGASGKTIDIGGLNILGNTTVNLSGYSSAEVGTLSGTATLSIAEGTTLSVGVDGASSSYSGTLSGGGAIELLAGAQTFSGPTSVSAISVASGATLTLGGVTSISDISVSGNLIIDGGDFSFDGSATFAEGASLSLLGVSASSVTGLDESVSGVQTVGATYSLASGSGTLSGLEASNVTINGASISSVDLDSKTASSTSSIYNIAEEDTVIYGKAEGIATVDTVNVLGTLDFGTTASVDLNLSGIGVVKFDTTRESNHDNISIALGREFQGTIDVKGSFASKNFSAGENAILNLSGGDSYSIWSADVATISSKVNFASNYKILLGNDLTLTNTVTASENTKLTILASWPNANNPKTLTLNDASLAGVDLQSGTIKVDGTVSISGDSSISGSVSGAGTLIFSGGETTWSGVGSLSGANVAINAGAVLDVSGENARIFQANYGGGSLQVQGTLKVRNYNYGGTLGGLKTNPGMVTLDGGTLVFTNSFGAIDDDDGGQSRATTVTSNGGKVVIEDGVSVVLTGNANGGAFITNGGSLTFDVGTDGSLLISAGKNSHKKISGSARVEKIGEGELTLSDACSYTGGTMISAGTLIAGIDGALGAGAVEISGGQLSISEGVSVSNSLKVVLTPAGHGDLTTGYEVGTGKVAIVGSGQIATGTSLEVCVDTELLATIWNTGVTKQYQIFESSSLLDGEVTVSYTCDTAVDEDFWNAFYDAGGVLSLDQSSGVLTLGIPEPSAFGLLAGAGALALVVARRKRRK